MAHLKNLTERATLLDLFQAYPRMAQLSMALAQEILRAPGELERGLAAGEVGDFDVHPAGAAPPADAQRLEGRLLSGEAGGVALVLVALVLAIGDFVFGENPLEETLAVALDRVFHAGGLGNIDSSSDNHEDVFPDPCRRRRSVSSEPER